jgi:hypothetical protein
MEDLLVSVSARVETIKNYGKDLLDVAVRIYNTFWPSESAPKRITLLAEKLLEIETQLDLWRESAGRAAADTLLHHILTWYEKIDLSLLTRRRTGSKWTDDPEWVARRQACAYSLVEYSPIHDWVEGPSFLESGEEEQMENVEDGSGEDGEDAASDIEDSDDDAELPPPAAP